MNSPLKFKDDLSIGEYSKEDESVLQAYLDMQEEFDEESFALPLEQEILGFIEDEDLY